MLRILSVTRHAARRSLHLRRAIPSKSQRTSQTSLRGGCPQTGHISLFGELVWLMYRRSGEQFGQAYDMNRQPSKLNAE